MPMSCQDNPDGSVTLMLQNAAGKAMSLRLTAGNAPSIVVVGPNGQAVFGPIQNSTTPPPPPPM